MQFIDYAIPCFELAKALNLDVNVVAHDLAGELKNQVGVMAKKLGDFEYEAVDGYINIQLSPAYLDETVKAAMSWLQAPKSYSDRESRDMFLIISTGSDKLSEHTLNEQAYQYIHDIYRLMHKEQTLAYILDDFSESILKQLSHHTEQTGNQLQNTQQQIRSHRRTKAFMSGLIEIDQNDPIIEKFIAVQASLAKKRKKSLDDMGVDNYELIFESSIVTEVQDYLDRLEDRAGLQIIKDPASRAIYYAHDNKIHALRSAGGMLYSAGYMLYELEINLIKSQEALARTLIVLAPSELHTLVAAYSQALITKHGLKTKLVCFDPRVAQADIIQLQSSISSVTEHFAAVEYLLASLKNQWLRDIKARQSLLSLIDLPETLNQAINNAQMPVLFDAISESVEMLTGFSQ